jgi:hypothetical protein
MTDQPTTDDAQLRAALADALNEPDHADWPRLIRRVEKVVAGRATWKAKAAEQEQAAIDAAYEAEGERKRADRAEAQVRDYENRITWETTCGEHARLLDACRTNEERAEQAEAGRIAADNMLRAVCASLGVGPDVDPVVKARETLARAERAEAAIDRVRRIHRHLAAQAVAFQDVLDDSDRGPWARTIRAELDALAAALDGPMDPVHILGIKAEPEPTACDAYQPPTTPEDSGICASCGMADWKHTPTASEPEQPTEHELVERTLPLTLTPSQLWAAIRNHALNDLPWWDAVRHRITHPEDRP